MGSPKNHHAIETFIEATNNKQSHHQLQVVLDIGLATQAPVHTSLCGQVLVLSSQCLVRSAAEDDFVRNNKINEEITHTKPLKSFKRITKTSRRSSKQR